MDKCNMPIGFFDSGVGGLSVLKEAVKLMPNENYIYYGDSINAPYGVRPTEEVKELTYKAVHKLLSMGAKGIVIACNTATSAAVAALRIDYPNIPIVGIEPAVKPAVAIERKGPVIIMATPMTLKQKKFNNLVERFKGDEEVIPMPCAGLMEFIEAGELDSERLTNYLKDKFKEYKNKPIKTIVLGCTHYPFIADEITKIVGVDVPIIDGGYGTCKEIKRRLELQGLLSNSNERGTIDIYNSLDREEIITLSKNLLKR